MACAVDPPTDGGGTYALPSARTPATAWSRTAAGMDAAFTPATVAPIVRAVSKDPMVDTPSALPTCRTVLFAPPADPAFSSGISDSTTFVSCAAAKPTPAPYRARPGRRCHQVIDSEITDRIRSTPPV